MPLPSGRVPAQSGGLQAVVGEPDGPGPFEDADQCRVSFLRRHALFVGTTGSGKTGGLNILMAALAPATRWSCGPSSLRRESNSAPGHRASAGSPPPPHEAAALFADAGEVGFRRGPAVVFGWLPPFEAITDTRQPWDGPIEPWLRLATGQSACPGSRNLDTAGAAATRKRAPVGIVGGHFIVSCR